MVSEYTRKKEEMKALQSTGFTNTSDIGNVFCMSALSFKDSIQFSSIQFYSANKQQQLPQGPFLLEGKDTEKMHRLPDCEIQSVHHYLQ